MMEKAVVWKKILTVKVAKGRGEGGKKGGTRPKGGGNRKGKREKLKKKERIGSLKVFVIR